MAIVATAHANTAACSSIAKGALFLARWLPFESLSRANWHVVANGVVVAIAVYMAEIGMGSGNDHWPSQFRARTFTSSSSSLYISIGNRPLLFATRALVVVVVVEV